MGWKVKNPVEARMEFIVEYQSGDWDMTSLCAAYGISRPTGYKWVKRFEEYGPAGLEDMSRAPHTHPNEVSKEVEEAILELRAKRPSQGPKKIREVLRRRHPNQCWPAISTIGEILNRHGLVSPRRRQSRVRPSGRPLSPYTAPNTVWCADFKGKFQMQDGCWCSPLTITDGNTRFLLRCQSMQKTDFARVWRLFEATLREYGLPEFVRTDNGPPFASTTCHGLSRLGVQFLKLGIQPERIEPGRPMQNGRHERFHRTLKAGAINPPRENMRQQQKAFDAFRQEYNEERPHESLGQRPPAELYTPSPRPYPARIRPPEYPSDMEVRKVRRQGDINWKGHYCYIAEALAGEYVGVEPVSERFLVIRYGIHPVMGYDQKKRQVLALPELEQQREKEKQ